MMKGGTGHDVMYGGLKDDVMIGGLGNDEMEGGLGNDEISGEGGIDTIDGGAGDDTIQGGHHDDIIYGGADDDTLYGETGNDTIYGGAGNDILDGGDGNDKLIDTEGDNEFWDSGKYGANTWEGGPGADKYFITGISNGRSNTIVNLTGNDTIYLRSAASCKNWTSVSASEDIEPELAKKGEDLESGPWTVTIKQYRGRRIYGFVCNIEDICVKVQLPYGRRC
jgi:Ca2+-binding RTX toxin-like protein